MESLLSDTKIYKLKKIDPLPFLQNRVKVLLHEFYNEGFLPLIPHKNCLTQTNTVLARAYGLPKVHKVDYPVRPIISTIKSPTHFLPKILYQELSECIPNPKSHINNSFDLIQKIKDLYIPEDHILISIDVVSLFTNIPCNLVLDSLDKRFTRINNTCKFPFDLVRRTTQFLFDNTFFSFNKQFYKQIFGTPMGSPISPLFANLVMEDLEEYCLNKLKELYNYAPLVYFRYVDDTLLCIRKDMVDIIVDIFNNYSECLKFTHEIECDNSLGFLDVRIIRNNHSLITNWYRKTTTSDRILNFNSNHSLHLKKNIIYNLVDRAILLSDERFHDTNISLIKKMLLDNNYNLNFINTHLNNRLRKIQFNKDDSNNNHNIISSEVHNTEKTPLFVLPFPYHKSLYMKCSRILKSYNIRTIPCYKKKLDGIIKLGKDPISKLDQPNTVYKLKCMSCHTTYIGETKRCLSKRVSNHKGYDKKSVVYAHCLENDHRMDWDGIQVLDRESVYLKRRVSETLHIGNSNDTLNEKEDTFTISRVYKNFIRAISNEKSNVSVIDIGNNS